MSTASLCFRNTTQTALYANKVFGYFINRYDPDTPWTAIGYCDTGYGNNEITPIYQWSIIIYVRWWVQR